MKKAFITTLTVSVIVITVLVIVIVYLLKRESAFHGTEAAADTAQEESVSEEIGSEYDVSEGIGADPATIDFDSVAKNSAPRPAGWYGTLESSGPMEKAAGLDAFKSECADVYARIEIPGTDIDYPIAYCEDANDPFWFSHDIHGNVSDAGMIITDSLNGTDFSDPVTLIYGHSPDDDTMFAQLHAFRDSQFFEDHDHIDIYTGDAQLIYRIYSCFISSADHIFASYDFGDPDDFTAYFDSIGDVRDLSMNVRDEAKPVIGDHVIILVTHCGDEDRRLFVTAVLDEVRY